jgi:hypothetical protein
MKRKERTRPFSILSGVSCRGYSLPLQRVITDFGADHPFNGVIKKLKEHYGIEIPVDSARKITEHHAHNVLEMTRNTEETVQLGSPKTVIIAEADGSMVPIVEYKAPPDESSEWDKRKYKTHRYCEARLSLAHENGSASPVFAATMGSVQEAGEQLMACVRKVGYNQKTNVHCVGDGAVWIADQVEERFGSNGTYLIDFYHLCEYLSAASTSCCAKGNEKDWMSEQKTLLKANQANQVLLNLRLFLEPTVAPEAEAPVRACHRYIKNRPTQLNYKTAIEQNLPIGSGEVESAHRYVIQKRLKIAGAWWEKENAHDMLTLRILRANNKWDDYWNKKAA